MYYTSVCKALYDYKAQSEDELTFKEDDILYILDKEEDPDWWRAQLKPQSLEQEGPVGMVPANYVDEADPIGKVQAIYDYTAQQDEELTFHEDDLLTLYENDDPDWYLVKDKHGKIGLAPSNYLQEASGHASAVSSTSQVQAPVTTPTTHHEEEEEEEDQHEIPAAPPAPPAPVAAAMPAANKADDAISWSVHEYDTEKKKKKKSKGNLLVGNGMLCYGSETDKSSPVRQFPILEVSQSSNDGKTVHIQLSDATLDFQASSKSEAKAIVAKIQESKSLAAPTTTPTTAAIPTQQAAIPEPQQEQHVPAPPPPPPPQPQPQPQPQPVAPPVVHHEPEPATTSEPEPEPEPACEPRWAIVLYDFTAEGPEEISTKEEDQVLVVDYVSSDEWWSIEYQDGRAGIVPATYVQFQEEYEADLAREEEQRRKQQEQEAEKQRREAEAAAARQRRIEEEQRQREEEARKAEEERQRRQQEEQQRQKEQEARRQAAAAAAAATASKPSPSMGAASPRRSQIPAPPPPVNKAPANRSSQPIPTPPVNKAKQPQDPGKPDPSKVRIWTDRTGAFKVEAQFLTYHNEKIRLHKVNGVKIDVPVQKMCLEDLRYIEQQTGKKLVEDGTDDVPLVHLANSNNSRNAPGSKPQWDWFDYFMKANIPMHNSLRYASAFQAEGLGEHDLDNLTHRKMKSLGMSETHVQRLQRFIETGVVEPASDEETPSSKRKMKKSVSFGAISVIDDSDNESLGGYGAGNRQHQIDEDERLARQLQEEYNAQAQQQGSPSIRGVGLQRRGTGRPTPSTSAPRDVNTDIMDKIKSQLSSQPLTPTPAQPPQSSSATATPPPPPPPPPAAAAAAPLQPTPVARQQTGFADDAWAPRASNSPNVSNAQPDAMAQTKAAWSAPPPPPPPAPPAQNQVQVQAAPMQNPNLTGIQQQQPLQQSPQQPPVSLPPRQRPTPPAPQNNKVDPQMLSQWTSPGQQSQPQQPQPQIQQPPQVQQMVAQFNAGNPPPPQQQQQQQQPALPPRSPMNQFMQSPTTTTQANVGMMQQQQPPLLPRSPMNQFNTTAQPQFMQQTGSPSHFAQQQPFMQQQQQQQPPVMQQPPMSSVPVNSVLPPALVPMNTGMQQPALQPQPTGSAASWAAATPDNPFGSGAIAQRPPPQSQGSFSSVSSMQPSQVFASMANNNNPGAGNFHDPNDKYAVFKNMNATAGSPSVFNAGQPQGGVGGAMPFQQPQATGFTQMQPQPTGNPQQPFQQQQQFYNRW